MERERHLVSSHWRSFAHVFDDVGMLPPPNASRFVGDVHGRRRSEARHREIWIRVDGRWCPGKVMHWNKIETGWLVWVDYVSALQDERGHGTTVGVYRYDPRAIVPRHDDRPPGEQLNDPGRTSPL